VAVLTDASIPCPLMTIVCRPNIAATEWDFSFLRGVRVMVLYRSTDHGYAMELCAALRAAGCAGVASTVVAGMAT
jgi:hypothetical protein